MLVLLSLLGAIDANAEETPGAPAPIPSETPVIQWQKFNAPPLMINSGAHAGSGIIDGITDIIIANLKDYQHKIVNLPHARFLKYVKSGQSYCTPYLFKTPERENFFAYSRPAAIYPGYAALMRVETHKKIGSPDKVSLNDLLNHHGLKTTANAKRSYGEELMPLLKGEAEEAGLVNYHQGSTTMVFTMMARNRADFIVEFPNRLNYWVKSMNLDRADFVAVPITEAPPFTISYVACTNNAWGQAIIKRVDQILSKYMTEPAYLAVLQRWSDDKNGDIVARLYNEHLLP